MATDTAEYAIHNTLSGTTHDEVSLTGVIVAATIKNKAAAGGADIYYTYSNKRDSTGAVVAPTTPAALANDTYYIPPGGFETFPAMAGVIVKVVGNNNAYAIEGQREA